MVGSFWQAPIRLWRAKRGFVGPLAVGMHRSPGGDRAPELDRELLELDRRQDDAVRTDQFGEDGTELVAGCGNDEYRNVGPLGGRGPIVATAQSPQELDCADAAERRVQHHDVK